MTGKEIYKLIKDLSLFGLVNFCGQVKRRRYRFISNEAKGLRQQITKICK